MDGSVHKRDLSRLVDKYYNNSIYCSIKMRYSKTPDKREKCKYFLSLCMIA